MWEARKQAGLTVALRKESVDRNIPAFRLCDVLSTVALRKESVDRNTNSSIVNVAAGVALRKESVDRNYEITHGAKNDKTSLSARRAWIEIALEATVSSAVVSRSPQGEYGMFLFLTVQGGFVHADIRFNFKNCYSKELSHKII